MQEFNRAYLWGLDMKYRMGLYATIAVFQKAIVNALLGEFSVDSLTMLEMLLVSFLFASAETAVFPTGKNWAEPAMGRRTALWAALANAVYIGSALGFGWFRGIPIWGAAVLLVILELVLASLWYALLLENRRDTKLLNETLRHFQQDS